MQLPVHSGVSDTRLPANPIELSRRKNSKSHHLSCLKKTGTEVATAKFVENAELQEKKNRKGTENERCY